MPKRREDCWPPKQHVHKGYARVKWGGVWYHLGRAGSDEAKAAYTRLAAAWRADPYHDPDGAELTVRELCRDYLKAEPFPPGRKLQYKRAVQLLTKSHAGVAVEAFGPVLLTAWQRTLVESRNEAGSFVYTREYVGMLVRIIRGVWKWGVATERVGEGRLRALMTVPGLRTDQGKPRRTVAAVGDGALERILPQLPRAARGLVLLLRYTGARPSELFGLTPADVDRSGEVWTYTPKRHKTTAKGKERVIFFGPKARAVLGEFDPGEGGGPYFVHQRGTVYTGTALNHAVVRACKRMGVERITPYQLRHTRLTEVRAAVGIEGAAAVGGHERISTTQIYTKRRNDLAEKVAGESG